MNRCLLLLSLAALASAGCVMGELDEMVALDRSLAPDEVEYINSLRLSPATKLRPVNVAGDAVSGATTGGFKERWFFPLYGDQKIIVSNGGRTAGAVHGEFPSLFPGLSEWLFFRWGRGASFKGNELSRRCSTWQLNPIIAYTHASGQAQTMGWELCIGKGLFAIGNTPRSLEGGGLILQLFWVIGRRSEYTVLETGF
jgi:hypothetical protein